MLIESIRVMHLFDEYDYNLELTDCLTFLHSPNGYGKSTLMHMLYSALRGDVSYLSSTPFGRMEVNFSGGDRLLISKESGNLELSFGETGKEERITPSEMSGIRPVTYIPPERLMVLNPDGTLSPALATFAAELQSSIRSAREDTVLVQVPREGRGAVYPEDVKELLSRLKCLAEAGFRPEIPTGQGFPPSEAELCGNDPECSDLFYSLRDYADRNAALAGSLNLFLRIVNGIFINKKVGLDPDGFLSVTMNNGTVLKLQNLSSGERQILIMFYTLLFRTEPGSIVILDEPEISLHVSWQQKLGDYFLDICSTRDMQMIVATHSPTVIHDKWDDARELKAEDARISHV